ncbi:uncharacterized protein LOC117791783 [Drosophila innubila]|uniref:uncharacterized protein LOC117791783 n=1 Tax=Drosophila innubila TaxID=198719 RepID=UPI00148C47CD|nr:uncharacterized protein LOC117791783 [Drosophila innubila]
MCLRKVREWLVLLTMENYLDIFKERGYMTIEHCKQIITSDLIMLGIEDPAHRKLLLDGVQLLHNSPDLLICKEPCDRHVTKPDQENIASNFQESWKSPPAFVKAEKPMTLPPAGNKDKIVKTLKTFLSCVACPHLKFANLNELDEHIAFFQKKRKDLSAVKHKPGEPICDIRV